jgi:threonine synthase
VNPLMHGAKTVTDRVVSPMTDNEKAATFIGWEGLRTKILPAPDMANPSNYMKALEAVRRRGYTWEFGGEAEHLIRTSDSRIYTTAIWGMGRPDLVKEVYGDSRINGDAASAVVAALAALYDAENQEKE